MLRLMQILMVASLMALFSAGGCAASGETLEDGECAVGSEKCTCTQGGSCDPGLECLSGICVDPNASPAGSGGSSNTGSGSGAGLTTTGSGGGMNCDEGCKAVDVLFAVDHSASMFDKIDALAASSAFTAVVDALAAVNCGKNDYRIGLTDDNTASFITPAGWTGSTPWFDSDSMDPVAIATAFNGAASQLKGGTETSLGCEHVLTNSVDLLKADSTGFLRAEALLVLVLITDVDDYGAYDQGTVTCGGFPVDACATTPTALETLKSELVAMKGNDEEGVAAIVIAGDPAINGGVNICNQPQTCTDIFHATRLWSFAGMLAGSNGYTANLCSGPASVPTAVETAFANNIDLACKGFEPPK